MKDKHRTYNTVIEGEIVGLKMDGDMWCCMPGENLQVGVAGFGKTKQEAVENYCKERNIRPSKIGYFWTYTES